MKLLIVEDDERLRGLLAHIARNEWHGVEVLEAGSLDEAQKLLPQANAVLCDGSFPTHPGRAFEPAATANGNWAPLHLQAARAAVPFVLLSGRREIVVALQEKHQEAFLKPLETIQAVSRALWLGGEHESTRPGEFYD